MPNEEVTEDFDKLRQTLAPMAKYLLERNGEFFPFAGVVSTDGEARVVAADIGKEQPTASEMIEFLTAVLHSGASKCRAAAICTDVLFRPHVDAQKTDGIQLSLEHRSGISLKFIIPYEKVAPGNVRLGAMQSVECKPLKPIFGIRD